MRKKLAGMMRAGGDVIIAMEAVCFTSPIQYWNN
jgi:hypothetical protein